MCKACNESANFLNANRCPRTVLVFNTSNLIATPKLSISPEVELIPEIYLPTFYNIPLHT